MLKKGFTIIELILVVVVITILSWFLYKWWTNFRTNIIISKESSQIQANLLKLNYTVWNLPNELNDVKQYKYLPVKSIILNFSNEGIKDYFYLTDKDYTNFFYDNSWNIKWFKNILDNNYFYKNKILNKKLITKDIDIEIEKCYLNDYKWNEIVIDLTTKSYYFLITEIWIFYIWNLKWYIDWINNFRIQNPITCIINYAWNRKTVNIYL